MTFDEACLALARDDYATAVVGFLANMNERPYEGALNLGQALRHLGDYAGAEAAYRRAISLKPDHPDGLYCLSEFCLQHGRFAEGWALFENRRRWSKTNFVEPRRIWSDLACPEWRGEDIRGKHLLVLGEQGFGDQIQFARYVPLLRQLGATASFVCSDSLAPLFPEGWPRSLSLPPAHFWVMAMSLPGYLGANMPPEPRLIRPPLKIPSRSQIGVAPTGSSTHSNDRRRSITGELAADLLELGLDLRPEATGARNFLQTAALIASLDLVISVDTSIAHLAASMGKPTWVLLARPVSDWRWMVDREDSPWYPTVRLFRQTSSGDWSTVIRAVKHQLRSASNSCGA